MSVFFLHLIFGIGGGLGAGARHALTQLVTHRFPLSTIIVNVAGSFLLGIGTGLLPSETAFVGVEIQRLMIGFCGGFTTFSSFAYQTLDLHREETLFHAACNIAISLILCLISYGAGLWISGAAPF